MLRDPKNDLDHIDSSFTNDFVDSFYCCLIEISFLMFLFEKINKFVFFDDELMMIYYFLMISFVKNEKFVIFSANSYNPILT